MSPVHSPQSADPASNHVLRSIFPASQMGLWFVQSAKVSSLITLTEQVLGSEILPLQSTTRISNSAKPISAQVKRTDSSNSSTAVPQLSLAVSPKLLKLIV